MTIRDSLSEEIVSKIILTEKVIAALLFGKTSPCVYEVDPDAIGKFVERQVRHVSILVGKEGDISDEDRRRAVAPYEIGGWEADLACFSGGTLVLSRDTDTGRERTYAIMFRRTTARMVINEDRELEVGPLTECLDGHARVWSPTGVVSAESENETVYENPETYAGAVPVWQFVGRMEGKGIADKVLVIFREAQFTATYKIDTATHVLRRTSFVKMPREGAL